MTRASGEHAYGRYMIRTLIGDRKIRARAFVGSTAVGDSEGGSLDEALSAMRRLLDERDTQLSAARNGRVPTAQEFADSFTRLERKIGKHHWLMVKAFLVAEHHTLTATEIAAAAGYSSFSSANEKFGKLARMIAEDLGYEPERRSDGSPIWTLTLATGVDAKAREDEGMWRWKMRPEVAEGLLGLNLGNTAASAPPL